MSKSSAIALAGFLAASFLVAAVSSTFTVAAIPHWYAALNKPSFNPPNGIFAPVWTLLYALMAIAAWLVWKASAGSAERAALRTAALRIFWLQLFLNFAWSWIFFREHLLAGALIGDCCAVARHRSGDPSVHAGYKAGCVADAALPCLGGFRRLS